MDRRRLAGPGDLQRSDHGQAAQPGRSGIERSKVDAVYPRGSKIVIETGNGRTLFEDDIEADKSAVRRAFVDLGYPWEGPTD